MIADPIDIKPDRRRARTRAALLRAGERLFAAQSVEAVSIDDIVAAADVAKGSFYNHFTDREALARAIAGQVRAEAEAQVDQINAGVTDPARRMARGQMVFARFALQNPQGAQAMMRLFAGATLPNAPLNRGVRADIEAGLAAGVFRGLSVETGVLMAMGMAMVAVGRILEPQVTTSAAEICRDLNFGLLRGLGVSEDVARAVSEAAANDIFTETRS